MILDGGFGKDADEGITERSQPWNPFLGLILDSSIPANTSGALGIFLSNNDSEDERPLRNAAELIVQQAWRRLSVLPRRDLSWRFFDGRARHPSTSGNVM